MPRQFLYAALIAGFYVVCLPAVYAGQHEHGGASEPEPDQLGTVSFPTSCSPNVEAGFERAVALLHSFGYNNAAKQFREVEQQDPACAIAYWGEAMTRYHQLWGRPSNSDLEDGWQLIQKAQAVSPKSDRERLYIEAAAAFYRDPNDRSYESRCVAYSQALVNLRDRYPQDREAAAFYALSLIASPRADENDFADRKKAVSILEALYAAEPNHPGVAHYLIHACDNPEMADQGLPAARRYAQIAPASPHALHMPSHIFARLGLWQDDIESNLASKAAAEKQSQTPDRLHAMLFLEYAYLQTGRDDQARAIETEALKVPKQDFEGDREGYFYYAQVYFPALLMLEMKTWKEVLGLQPPAGAGPEYQAIVDWAQAVAAGHLHDAALARTAVSKYDAALDAVKKTARAYVADQMSTERDEAHAWLAMAEGRREADAVRLLTLAAAQQDKIGKGEADLPAREMLADMLLQLNRPEDALAQYTTALKTDPNRFNALYGAARAAELVHQPDLANRYYKQLLANCDRATGSDRAELAHAKAQLGRGQN